MNTSKEMLIFYWGLGRNLEMLKAQYDWGTGSYKAVSDDIKRELPDVKSFSPRNLLYMHQFYRLYSTETITPQVEAQLEEFEITPQAVAQMNIFMIPWGHHRFIIDMLFYNITLHCYVVIEVKIRSFEPGDMGQIGTYVAAVDGILRKEGDAPTVGLLVCKNKDNVLAQYAVNSSNAPVGISEYELSDLMPVNFKGTLPSIEEIERELKER